MEDICCLCVSVNAFVHLLFVSQPEAPAASSFHGSPRPEEEDDGDLNKALGVQRFQQILSPSAVVPDEQHHNYHEEDIECKHTVSATFTQLTRQVSDLFNARKTTTFYLSGAHFCCVFLTDHRHSSHHIHRPLSKLPLEGRRKKSNKKRRKDKDHKSSHIPSSGPIEEGEDEEEEDEEGLETTSGPSESERVKDVEVITGVVK